MPQRLEFEFGFSTSKTASPRSTRGPMRMLILGDFSGRESRGEAETDDGLAERSIAAVDVDTFDQVFSRLAPRLRLSLGATSALDMELEFGHLEDFHPDQLYERLDLFKALRDTRARLVNPDTFPQAAAELRHEAQQPTETTAARPNDERILAEGEDAMLERLLGRPHTEPRGRAKERPLGPPTRDITQLIRHLVAPYIVPEADPFQAQYVAAVDEAISREMRGLLHHPTFQALEANWRALNWLVTSLETGEDLKLYVLDVSKEELLATFEAAGSDLEQWSLYRLLVEKERKTPGGEPWSVLVGCYDFGATTRDLRLLAALGALASQAGGPVLAAAEPTLLGCRSLIECADPRNGGPMDENAERAWQALRESAFAPWIGLSMPRILLRLPYGERTDATERFAFEELAQQPDHEAFLWGNPAFACALLIAQAFEASGWSMEPGDRLDVEDLPAYTYEEDGEPRMLPCAEVFLTERAAEAILNRGIMPLVSYRNRNAVRLMRFQSIARPAKPVTGQWV